MSRQLEFSFPVVEDMREFVSEIVFVMAKENAISVDEALGILNRHWKSFAIGDDNLLGHEEPEYWARTIYEQYR